jgi:hypothetical protein
MHMESVADWRTDLEQDRLSEDVSSETDSYEKNGSSCYPTDAAKTHTDHFRALT